MRLPKGAVAASVEGGGRAVEKVTALGLDAPRTMGVAATAAAGRPLPLGGAAGPSRPERVEGRRGVTEKAPRRGPAPASACIGSHVAGARAGRETGGAAGVAGPDPSPATAPATGPVVPLGAQKPPRGRGEAAGSRGGAPARTATAGVGDVEAVVAGRVPAPRVRAVGAAVNVG